MATVGGNLAHGDPANDHPATMLALGAQIVATGPAGERIIPIEEFFLSVFTTDESTLPAQKDDAVGDLAGANWAPNMDNPQSKDYRTVINSASVTQHGSRTVLTATVPLDLVKQLTSGTP